MSQQSTSKVTPILMPQAGNSMEEGTVLQWYVKEGDEIKEGQAVAEIETDKASMELEAEAGGRIAKLLAQEGDIVAVKAPVALLADNDKDAEEYIKSEGLGGGDSSTKAEAKKEESPAATPAPAAAPAPVSSPVPAATNGGRIKASPLAKRIAAEKGIDLNQLPAGSGPHGRILSSDLPASGGAAPAPVLSIPPAAPGEIRRTPISKMRNAIGKSLQASKQTVPHFYVKMTVDAEPLYQFYQRQKPLTGITLNDALMSICARALMEFPAFRTRQEGNEYVEYPSANIGVAVGIDQGLVVPVVSRVDQLDLATLGRESRRIIEAARRGKVEGAGSGVFTISNLGMFGVDEFTAIVNPPEAAILAVGAMKENVVVRGGMMKIGKTMTLTLSCDHRVVDGMVAGQFSARLKDLLENPHLLEV